MDFTIRQADSSDLKSLVDLNQKWQRDKLLDFSNGFLSAGFDEETFEKIIDNGEIVVIDIKDSIKGYYMVNNFSRNGVLKFHFDKVTELKEKGIVGLKAKVGLGTQVVI